MSEYKVIVLPTPIKRETFERVRRTAEQEQRECEQIALHAMQIMQAQVIAALAPRAFGFFL